MKRLDNEYQNNLVMIRNIVTLYCLLVSCFTVLGQKEISLEAIWGRTFRAERLGEIKHLSNGEEFCVLQYSRSKNATKIVAKKYGDENDERLILSAMDIPEMDYFEIYEFNADESKVLLGVNQKVQYRYSRSAEFYVYDFKTKKAIQLSTDRVFNPTFSPDGKNIAYGVNNNIFITNLVTRKTAQVTVDGEKNSLINGMSDWVYEEEFELVRAFEWNSKGTHLAYLKFDESKVKEFSMTMYGAANYPFQSTFKYPKAGELNSEVTLHVFSLNNKLTTKVDLLTEKTDYIPRIKWTNNPDLLCVQVMNREQNKLEFNYVSSKGKLIKPFYTETDKAYVEISDDLIFLKNNSFIKSNEKSGFRHLYHYTKDGEVINQITKGNWEVTDFYGVHNGVLYYQSTEAKTTERHIYSINLDGTNKKCLTIRAGTHNADFNTTYSLFIDEHSSIDTALNYTVKDAVTSGIVNVLVTNKLIEKKYESYNPSKKRIKTININGETLNMWMVKPKNFVPTKKYPVLLYQYAGPGSQMVANKWNGYNDYWHQLLAQKGYIIACVDGRGTGLKGANFKKQTQHQLGKLEAEDQIAFAKELGNLPFVDKSRIGIWGWSYGGFNALNSILKGAGVFKTAIAVAPVTHWKFYDTIYTERFLETPQNNSKGYDDNSPLSFASNLQGNVLLVHGTADDNVHFQNTLAMVDAFTKANKQFDLAVYTDKNHGIYGGVTRLQLYTKMTNYILEKL